MPSAPTPSTDGLDFYTLRTPNGLKVNIALAELNALGTPIKYKEHKVDLLKNEQKEPWFLAINPNGRVPAVIDRSNDDLVIWESGSILRYLAERGGYGPMAGQAGFFLNSASEQVPYAAKRYLDESARLLDVYEARLSDRDYLVGSGTGKFSYADIAIFPWIRSHVYSLGLTTLSDNYPHVTRWIERISARDATQSQLTGDIVEMITSRDGWEEEVRKKREWVFAKA
ncbi:hypothetical protein JCM11491_005047 [Sporobolomyces phaffii]